jgi:hypothetical protein
MRAKLKLSQDALVPNGVDPELSRIPRSGDSRRRLIVLGHFFNGRTDFQLLEEVVRSGRFDEIFIGSPGSSSKMSDFLRRLKEYTPAKVVVREWVSHVELSEVVGPRTVALIPHVVNDYTLSQDPMKLYQFLALGVRTICPRLLWPKHLDESSALLVDIGVKLGDVIHEWCDAGPVSDDWRIAHGEENSWRSRALRVARLVERDL